MTLNLSLDDLLVTASSTAAAALSFLFADDSPIAFMLSKGLHGQLSTLVRPQDIIYEAPERRQSNGELSYALDQEALFVQLAEARKYGCQRLVVLLMHADKFPQHETIVAALAQPLGFTALYLSEQLSAALLQPWQQVEQKHAVLFDKYHQHALNTDHHWLFLQPANVQLKTTKPLLVSCYRLRQRQQQLETLPAGASIKFAVGDVLICTI